MRIVLSAKNTSYSLHSFFLSAEEYLLLSWDVLMTYNKRSEGE